MAPTSNTVGNDELEHTAGGATTRDGMDPGVPMAPGRPNEEIGPEDALGAGAKRGDYSERVETGKHFRTEVIPAHEREPDGPAYRMVDQAADVGKVRDAEGKGGVSTAAAREVVANLADSQPGNPGTTASGPETDASSEGGDPAKADGSGQ